MKKDCLSEKEYRYGCSIDCGSTPLRVYQRPLGSQGGWTNYEDYMNSPTFVWYNHSTGGSSDYAWLPGHWISSQEPPGEGSMFYQDAFGVQVVAGDFDPQQEPPENRLPDYAMQDLLDNLWLYLPKIRIGQSIGYWPHPSEIFAPLPPPPAPPPIQPATPPSRSGRSESIGSHPGTGDQRLPPEPNVPGFPGIGMTYPPDIDERIFMHDCQSKFKLTAQICDKLKQIAYSYGCEALFHACGEMPDYESKKRCMMFYDSVCGSTMLR